MTCWLCGFETTELATNAKAPTCQNDSCQICIAVANIDEEINQAVATLRRLLTKRCDLRSEQNRAHGTLIHQLPNELKNYIFELLLPTRTEWGELLPTWRRNAPGRMRPRIEKPAILLCPSVCRDWRNVAWANPWLWSTIHIGLGNKFPPSPSSSIKFVHDWITRSQTLPLTLHIVVHDMGSSEQELAGVIDVIDVISDCSNRWHSLSLDIPLELLRTFHRSNFQCHLLKNLRINSRRGRPHINQPVSLPNPTMSPEKVEIHDVPFHSLQISWNHLTFANVQHFDLEDLVQLFRHASQMTCCHILEPRDETFPIRVPPIIHRNLKTLGFCNGRGAQDFLRFLTLPGLQEFHANEMFLLEYLPALVHRSSCPLTRITFDLVSSSRGGEYGLFDYLQPLPGMTDLVIENLEELDQTVTIRRLLLEEYFPDLCNLTLRLEAFHFLWDEGVISLLLDRKRSHLDSVTKRGHPKILVMDQRNTGMFDVMDPRKSYIEERLNVLQVDFNSGEDGFEILIPED